MYFTPPTSTAAPSNTETTVIPSRPLIVYLISCGKCGKQYVGETKGPLNIRTNGHRDDWRHKRFERSPTA